jgi:hypothetical protein
VITVADLQALAESRLADAEALLVAKRHAGSVYLCGYAVELALKARVARTLGWPGWPDTGEFKKLESFKTHDLATLLHLSGVEIALKGNHTLATAWAGVAQWDPETRYKVPDKNAVEADAIAMIDNTKLLTKFLAL